MAVAALAVLKINGIMELDCTNVSWDAPRGVTQHVTGAGVQNAVGLPMPTISFDEVINKNGVTNFLNLSNFSVQVYDYETRSILYFSGGGFDWDHQGGSSDLASATTKRKISAKGKYVSVI